MNEPADAVSCRGTAEPVHQAAVLRPCCRPAAGTRMKTIPPALGKRPAASAARTSAPSSGKSGRSISRAPATAVRLAFVSARTRSTRSIPLSRDFSDDTSSKCLGVRQARLVLDCATVSARSETVWSHARWSRASPMGTSVRTRRPGPSRALNALIKRTWPASRSGFPPGNARTDKSRPTTAQSRAATMTSSHGANPRSMRLSSVGEMPAAPATVASDRAAAVRAARNSAPRSASRRRPRRAPRDA